MPLGIKHGLLDSKYSILANFSRREIKFQKFNVLVVHVHM